MHWAEEIAERLISENPEKECFVCSCGISPSGSVHIGNFRDVATSYFVVKALEKKGKKAKLLFSWDDFDRLRKVPSNVAKITTGFEQYIGMPYTFIPSPYNDDVSYGKHFEIEFEKSLKELRVDYEVRYQTQEYMSFRYLDKIKLSLEKRKQIYDIIMSFKTQDADEGERENYYPISVYCKNCKKDNTKVISYDEETGDLVYYCRDCQEEHKVNVNTYNLIKLVWKVDWPMRWEQEQVDFEPGGIDHASQNGSYDVGTVIAREIFNFKAPMFQGYGWLGIKGLGDMHSSSGMNITPAGIMEIYEPNLVRWLFCKYKPEDAFDFAFDDMVIRHYSEYDKGILGYKEGTGPDYEKTIFEFVLDGETAEEKTPFGSIASIAPIVDFNPESTKNSLKKAGINFDENSLVRLEKVKNWICKFNPNKLYTLLESFNEEYYNQISEEEKESVAKLVEYIEENDFTEKEIQQKIYDSINDPNLTKKENVEKQKRYFKTFYNLLFGRDDGPRLYLFFAAVDKTRLISLLKK